MNKVIKLLNINNQSGLELRNPVEYESTVNDLYRSIIIAHTMILEPEKFQFNNLLSSLVKLTKFFRDGQLLLIEKGFITPNLINNKINGHAHSTLHSVEIKNANKIETELPLYRFTLDKNQSSKAHDDEFDESIESYYIRARTPTIRQCYILYHELISMLDKGIWMRKFYDSPDRKNQKEYFKKYCLKMLRNGDYKKYQIAKPRAKNYKPKPKRKIIVY